MFFEGHRNYVLNHLQIVTAVVPKHLGALFFIECPLWFGAVSVHLAGENIVFCVGDQYLAERAYILACVDHEHANKVQLRNVIDRVYANSTWSWWLFGRSKHRDSPLLHQSCTRLGAFALFKHLLTEDVLAFDHLVDRGRIDVNSSRISLQKTVVCIT